MSVYRSAHGNWMVEVAHRDPTSKKARRIRRVSPVNTQAGAKKYELEVRRALQDGTFETQTEAPTLEAFAEDYLTYSDANNRARTVREKRATFARSILPALGKVRIDAIGARELEAFKAARLVKRECTACKGTGTYRRKRYLPRPCARCSSTGRVPGLHPKTVNEEVGLIISTLRLAAEWGLISAAPKVRKLKLPPRDFDFLDFEELDRLVAATEFGWAEMILIAGRTGLRSGELRALQDQRDVDYKKKQLTVREALDDRGVAGPPKNGRTRVVPLSDDALAAFRELRHLKGPHVFCNPDGAPFTHRQMERALQKACKRTKLREIGWHVLRHTFASHLAMRGYNATTIQSLGGWETIAMVNRYSHLSPDARREAVQALDSRTTKGQAEDG